MVLLNQRHYYGSNGEKTEFTVELGTALDSALGPYTRSTDRTSSNSSTSGETGSPGPRQIAPSDTSNQFEIKTTPLVPGTKFTQLNGSKWDKSGLYGTRKYF